VDNSPKKELKSNPLDRNKYWLKNMEKFWLACLSQFEKDLPSQQFNTWIRPLKIESTDVGSGEIRLRAPNRFVLQWVKERFAPKIEARKKNR